MEFLQDGRRELAPELREEVARSQQLSFLPLIHSGFIDGRKRGDRHYIIEHNIDVQVEQLQTHVVLEGALGFEGLRLHIHNTIWITVRARRGVVGILRELDLLILNVHVGIS